MTVTVQILLACPFLLERKFDLAIAQVNQTMQLEPRTTQLHLNIANAYEANKQYDKALDEYEQFDIYLEWLKGGNLEQTTAWYQHLRVALHEKGPRGRWQD